MGIANSILEGVEKELRLRPGSRAVKVGVRIGELAGVDPDALNFAFEALTLDTPRAALKLEVEYVAPRSRCRDCRNEFEVRNYELLCPSCGSLTTERISGDEMEFVFLEIEEPEAEATNQAEGKLKYSAPAMTEVKNNESCIQSSNDGRKGSQRKRARGGGVA
ncbi:MAG TPA: hydrogenase maturation nickel metallochaperone HypA [Terriglobales bacterium]|nr:hydrogenase maturation nickel metallochaperone HypA [Terriglobales bacterium]